MLDPFPLILLKPSKFGKGRLPTTKGFVLLYSRPRGKTKGVKTLQSISNIILILNDSQEGVIYKMAIHKLIWGVWKGNTMDPTL